MKWCTFATLLASVTLVLAKEKPDTDVAPGEAPPVKEEPSTPAEGTGDKANTRFHPGHGGAFGHPGLQHPGLGAAFGQLGSGAAFGQPGFGQQGFGQPGLVQPGFGQLGVGAGFGQPGLGHHGLVQPGFTPQTFGQQNFGQQGIVPTGLGQGLGQPFGQSLLAQPGLGTNSFGQATLSGVPVAGQGNRPVVSPPSASCRQWCRGTKPGQIYCCEDNSQIHTVPIVKPGTCPLRRPICPKVHGPPITCGDDSKCSGADKCCLDACLEVHVCKPAIF